MAVFTEANRSIEFLMNEADGTLSRETITLVSGAGALDAGTVLGKITASGKYSAYNNNVATGIDTAAAILCYATDATAADTPATVIFRLAEVATDKLVWAAANSPSDKTAGLAELAALKNIVAR